RATVPYTPASDLSTRALHGDSRLRPPTKTVEQHRRPRPPPKALTHSAAQNRRPRPLTNSAAQDEGLRRAGCQVDDKGPLFCNGPGEQNVVLLVHVLMGL